MKIDKYWPGGSYLVIKSTPRSPIGVPLLSIGYKYNYRKVLRFIVTEEAGSTEPGDSYLSRFPDIYSNFSVRPVVCPRLIGSYFNSCNTIYNHNSMQQYDIALDKYWLTQSGYLDLQLQWHWVWVLQMGISYTVMVLQR